MVLMGIFLGTRVSKCLNCFGNMLMQQASGNIKFLCFQGLDQFIITSFCQESHKRPFRVIPDYDMFDIFIHIFYIYISVDLIGITLIRLMGSLCREHEEALIYCRFSNLSQAIAMTGFLLENKLTRTPASLVIAVRHCSCVCSFSVLSPLRSQRSQQLRL